MYVGSHKLVKTTKDINSNNVKVEVAVLGLIVLMVSVDVKQH